MKLFNALNSACRGLTHDPAGQRFKKFFVRIHGLGVGVLLGGILLGILLTATGFLLGFVPGVPGIVLGFAGVGLIAAQFKSSAQFADRLEITLRKFLSWLRGFFIRPAPHCIERPKLSPRQLEVNGKIMNLVDDGQHTGLESRFEEEVAKALQGKKS